MNSRGSQDSDEGRNRMSSLKIELPTTLLRISGYAGVLAGILVAAAFGLHPAGEEATHGTEALWVPAHSLAWISFTLALLGWTGIHLVQAAKARRLGTAAFCVVLLGTSYASWIFSSDVTFVPVIAAREPGLFQVIFSGSHILIGVTSVLSWVLGNVLFGAAIIRAKVFPLITGILLAVGSLVFPVAYLLRWPEKIIFGGSLLIGLAQLWLGIDLLRLIKPAVVPEGNS